jgi:hypothetical protein
VEYEALAVRLEATARALPQFGPGKGYLKPYEDEWEDSDGESSELRFRLAFCRAWSPPLLLAEIELWYSGTSLEYRSFTLHPALEPMFWDELRERGARQQKYPRLLRGLLASYSLWRREQSRKAPATSSIPSY